MVINPVILVAIVLQGFISKASRIAGAIVGYMITTGILLWGISVYGEGAQIAFFGIPLSEQVFFIACLVWYGFDTKEFMEAKKAISLEKDKSPTVPLNNATRIEEAKEA